MVAHIADYDIQNHIIARASTMAYARGGRTDVRPSGTEPWLRTHSLIGKMKVATLWMADMNV